jgi:hypothetical protein
MDSALHQRGLKLGVDFSVMILGSVDVASEHLARFDVTGNSNAEKAGFVRARIVRERIAGRVAAARAPITCRSIVGERVGSAAVAKISNPM